MAAKCNKGFLSIVFLHQNLSEIKSLLGTKVKWMYYILKAFNAGDLQRYRELCHVHKAALNAQPGLVENDKKLLEKINILCLMEIIFRHMGSEDLLFFPISLQCWLISKVQVEGTMHVSWVQPRVLGILQVKFLRDWLDGWLDKVHTALLSMEAETPYLVIV
ncbi:hypothetical protein EUGRSUZ_E02062 [Eucalyptus grandis]|uniref:Uncharacterized protein n=2 Tax=Eucalyptus grandis TaxID=71139 RepID=A0ACC3KVM7_EUCGR|nr:hypothetical protein EUGRSUZ_E02062 [Eucalyptus grandis]